VLAAGLRSGLPVVDAIGLVGQLMPGLSRRKRSHAGEQSGPADARVSSSATGQRGLAAGSGHGQMELRYMPTQTTSSLATVC